MITECAADGKFMPHGYCYLWQPEIVWSHAISDAIIAISYFIIPFALIYILRQRKDIKFKGLFFLFGAFIVACGTTHIISIINIWDPQYKIDAVVKIITAIASLPTALILIKLIPNILNIPSTKQYEKLNGELKEQIEKLKEKDKTLEKVKEFEFLGDLLPQILWTSNPDGNLDYYNKRWFEYTGMTFEQTQGWGWKPVLHPDDLQNCMDVWTDSYTSGRPYEVEYRFKRAADGEYRWHLGRALPMKNQEGEIVKWFGSCTDIHDQKMMAEALKSNLIKSENLLKEVFDNTYDALVLHDGVTILDCNAACVRLFEFESKAEFLKASPLMLSTNTFSDYEKNEIKKSIQNKKEWIGEAEYVSKEGKKIWGSVAVKIVVVDTKEVMLVRIIDISYKRRNEDLLRKSEAEFRAMSEASPLGIFVTDALGDCTYTNKEYQHISGLSFEQALGNGWSKAIYHEDKEKVFKSWYNAATNKLPFSDIFRYETPGKEIRWVSVKASAIEDNGIILGYVGTVDNITEIKLSEKKFYELSERLVLATNAGNIGIWDWDIINNELKWDELMYTLYGTTSKSTSEVYKTWESSLHPDDTLRCNEEIQMAISGKKEFDTEFCIIWPDKSLHYIKGKASVHRNSSGQALRMIGTNWDITEKKNAERDLRIGKQELEIAKESAEKASEAKSKFLASMSHEIRTPLNGIIGFTQVLKNTNLLEKQIEYVDHITTSGKVLLKLIGDILDLSKIEEGKLSLISERFHLKQAIQSTLNPYSFKANEKSLDFQLTVSPELDTWMYGDSHRIGQVLINLIGNSIKFTNSGGVYITCEQASAALGEMIIKFSITDTGIGVPIENQKDIFQPFTQANKSVVKEFGGTGLGLSIAKELVTLMGGQIGIISPVENDSGTTIWFTIKLSIDSNYLISETNEESNNTTLKFNKKINVLLAEDNFINQRLAEVVLNNLGCKVDFANDGQEALDMLRAQPYDIILMDIQMPRVDGLKASTIIRRELSTAIPIIGLSANVFDDDIQNSINAGMNDHIGKPYTEKQIYDAIHKQIYKN